MHLVSVQLPIRTTASFLLQRLAVVAEHYLAHGLNKTWLNMMWLNMRCRINRLWLASKIKSELSIDMTRRIDRLRIALRTKSELKIDLVPRTWAIEFAIILMQIHLKSIIHRLPM